MSNEDRLCDEPYIIGYSFCILSIQSHHPLRETLINQSGKTEIERAKFLSEIDRQVINKHIHRWQPAYEFEAVF
jgi:hypothetical protein